MPGARRAPARPESGVSTATTGAQVAPRKLTDEERVIRRAMALMANGKARGWSHAIDLAAQTLKRDT